MSEAGVKTVYLIVHGQKQLLEQVIEKLVARGFQRSNMQPASLEKAGNKGDFVAMVWPPSAPKEIVVSEITGNRASESQDITIDLGAWTSVGQKELYRISLR
ncbi:MAG: hypothetical protein FIO02_00280 [Nitrosopumilales archaeon]|jgi:hypothetical protein|nr:hypothetical protein [Nitrosopumilales archaeon]